jgi:putative ABC transport system permease protein
MTDRGSWLAEFVQDVRYAARQLRRAPGASALIIATLAIGIGANVTMVGTIDRLLLRAPDDVRDPDRVARLVLLTPDAHGGRSVGELANYPMLLDLEREAPAFAAVSAVARTRLSLGTGAEAVPVRASLVSASYFSLLGVRPAFGRFFSPDDGYPATATAGGPPLAVLAHGFWQRQFGGAPNVLGQSIRLGRSAYTIVGVAPRGFRGSEADAPDVWLPITVAAEQEGTRVFLADRGSVWLSIIGRLAAGASRSTAETQATAVWHSAAATLGSTDVSGRVVAAPVVRGRGPEAPREVKVALWLGGVSALVLVIACANVANLLLGRAFVRRREIAVRLALGAGRGRLARQMLAEALVLAGVSAMAALYLAVVCSGLLQHLFASDLVGGRVLDLRLLGFTALVALGTAVIIAMAPLGQGASPDLADALRAGTSAGGGRSSRVRMALVGTQAMLCMVLLIGAGLFAQSLRRVKSLDLGVDLDHTVMAWFDLNGLAVSRSAIDTTYATMIERVRAVPGVVRVALAESDPYSGGRAVAAYPPGRDPDEFWHEGVAEIPLESVVDSGFFRTVGATSLRGRDFASTDRRGAPRVAIVNEPLARILWPGEEALGKCVLLPARAGDRGGECATVVGVLGGFWRRSILNRESLVVYIPLAQRTTTRGLGRPRSMVVRVSGDPSSVVPAIRSAIQSAHPDLPAVSVTTLRERAAAEMRPWRLGAGMFSLFGGVALIIAVVGLYGVVSFMAAQRATEIAVRIALGARPRDVLAVIGKDGLGAVLAGLLVGTVLALVVRRWVGSLLFETSPTDPAIIAAVGALLLSVAVAATLVPTVRALRRNPATVLRTE